MKIINKRQIELLEQLMQIQCELKELELELEKENLFFGTRYITDDGFVSYQDFWSFGIGDSKYGIKQELSDYCFYSQDEFDKIKMHEHLQKELTQNKTNRKTKEYKL